MWSAIRWCKRFSRGLKMLKINLINQYDSSLKDYKKTIMKVLKQAYKELAYKGKYIINIVLVDDESIRVMNRDFRQKDAVTDVISFENEDSLNELGDIFISIDKAKDQASTYGHGFTRELGFLTVHGFLHCSGYDHLTVEDEKVMFDLQETILKKCHITR